MAEQLYRVKPKMLVYAEDGTVVGRAGQHIDQRMYRTLRDVERRKLIAVPIPSEKPPVEASEVEDESPQREIGTDLDKATEGFDFDGPFA